jgi:ankyrin repeat protein
LKDYCKGNIGIQDEDGDSPFFDAVAYNPRPEITGWFLKNLRTHEINRKDEDGTNALCFAAIFSTKPEVLKLLVSFGLDPNEKIKKGLVPGYTPFLLALETNTNIRICEYFINELHCDVNQLDYINVLDSINNLSIEEYLEDDDIDGDNLKQFRKLLRENQNGLKRNLEQSAILPLMCALQNKNIKIFEKILSCGADIEMINQYTGVPLFHLVARIKSQPEYFDILKSYGCDEQERNKNDFTPLHSAACLNGSIPVFEWLLKHGININEVTDDGETGLHQAAYTNSHPDVIEWFMKNGVDKTIINDDGFTAFQNAVCDNPSLQILKEFLKYEDINKADEAGITPLHIAISGNENSEIYQWLVLHGAQINAQDDDGDTPLHWAVRFKMKDRIKWLIQQGADTNIRNNEGKKALPWYVRLWYH